MRVTSSKYGVTPADAALTGLVGSVVSGDAVRNTLLAGGSAASFLPAQGEGMNTFTSCNNRRFVEAMPVACHQAITRRQNPESARRGDSNPRGAALSGPINGESFGIPEYSEFFKRNTLLYSELCGFLGSLATIRPNGGSYLA